MDNWIYSLVVVMVIESCLCQGSDAQSASWPVNTAALYGQTASLSCERPFDVDWSLCASRGNCMQISDGENIVIANPGNKYSIAVSGNAYRLNIDNLEWADIGMYRCESLFASDTYGELIVLDDTLSCSMDATDILIENTTYTLTCHVTYAGRWAPSVRCRIQASDWLRLQDNSTSSQGTFWTRATASRDMLGSHVTCDVYYDFPRAWESLQTDEASNKPEVSGLAWMSSPLDVLFAPRDITIQPPDAIFEVGQTVTCSASANPDPVFTWFDATTDVMLGQGMTLTFTGYHVGVLRVRCEAMVNIGGQGFADSVTRELLICTEDTCPTPVAPASSTAAIVVGSVLGVLLALSISLNILVLARSKVTKDAIKGLFNRKTRDKNARTDADTVPQYRAPDPPISTITNQGTGGGHHGPGYEAFYQYIDENDVTTLNRTTPRSRPTSAGDYSPQHNTTYEPVNIRYSNVPANQGASQATPTPAQATPISRTLSNDRQDYRLANQPRRSVANDQRSGSVYSNMDNLTFRDDSILTYQLSNNVYSDDPVSES